ncbi:sugar kinase [Neptunicella marina]|uniref:2-dehydro-3-deoxygluconokinase n=1 Tax=Neptunicella marina TaxID=2125989 RepID=A0A8J6ITT9_9ALTE|nr:sugar kinase [Neptunicella marina]MBC3765687.1 sugar kinase [Neptunicella marina]
MAKSVIFGECMVELSAAGQNLFQQTFAGDTFNTAIYLKRCLASQSVHYLSALGQDALSEQLLSLMQSESLATDLMLKSADKTLGLYMINTDEHGERSFAYWRSDAAAKQTLTMLELQQKCDALLDADSFFFSGISLAILSEQDKARLLDLVAELKQQGCKIIFDPNYRPRLWQSASHARDWTDKAYALADIAFPGRDDHKELYAHPDIESIYQHVNALGVSEMIIKNGAESTHLFLDGEHSEAPVQQVDKVVDTTSAGDGFNGAYLAARFAGKSMQQAAVYGAKVAAFVIGHRGAIVESALMQQFLADNPL